jgi:hypothetical protein
MGSDDRLHGDKVRSHSDEDGRREKKPANKCKMVRFTFQNKTPEPFHQ